METKISKGSKTKSNLIEIFQLIENKCRDGFKNTGEFHLDHQIVEIRLAK